MHVKLLLRRLSDYTADVSQIFSRRLTDILVLSGDAVQNELLSMSFIMSKYNLINYIYIYIYILGSGNG